MTDRSLGRATFDEVAELYDAVRPHYPAALADDLLALARVGEGDRVLEIGPGTGQLSVALASRGVRLHAVELGANLAAVARRSLASFPDVRIDVADFETWTPPSEPFDLVVSATAFHWLDPATRLERVASVLTPDAALAVISTVHVASGDPFFDDVQECYVRWDPDVDTASVLPTVDDVPRDDAELEGSALFGPLTLRRHVLDVDYTAEQYLDVLATYSGHRLLPPANYDGLLGCIAEFIDRRYGGRVRKRYLFELRVAPRLR
ncbi:MAG: class I SAM-dependent methyltransferase [Propionibacteriales bacterium]|nr:class I SAM-dependent methyltransferase [Propionibacteriales bacterium]